MAIMSKSNRKRHTKPCLYFQTNDCPLSANECDFAHVIATPEQFEALRNPQATLRTKPCRFFLGGQCRDGYWCRFKHPANVLATSRESDPSLFDDVPELDSDKGTDDDVDIRDLEGAYKAAPEEHPKYRTRPCRNFILGKCAYGDRCSYLHVVSPPTRSMNGIYPPSASTVRTSPASYPPTTPPPHRVPPSTPVNNQHVEADVDPFELDSSAFKTPVRSNFRLAVTPSSSGYSEEPATPASPETPTANGYTPFARNNISPLQLSPLSPLSYMGRRYMAKSRGPLDCLPLSPPLQPPLSMYSPTSPLPLQIVHVPFAVPMYQEVTSPTPTPRRSNANTMKSHPILSRACSQPEAGGGGQTKEASPYRAKPCRFFAETGKCQKGNRCDFIHVPPSTSPLDKRHAMTQKEVEPSTSENEPKAPSEDSKRVEISTNESNEEKSNNFYKISWRVVGGGVKIGTDKTEHRRHSEDASTLYHTRPSSKNPFDSLNVRVPTRTTALGPLVDLKMRSESNGVVDKSRNSSLRAKKGIDRELSLTLGAYSLSKASAKPKSLFAAAGTRPVIVVQGDDGVSESLLTVPRQEVARAKSSPSSPVTPLESLPSVIFSAESP